MDPTIIIVDYTDPSNGTNRTLVKATASPDDVAFYAGTSDNPPAWVGVNGLIGFLGAYQVIPELRDYDGHLERAGGLGPRRDWVLQAASITGATTVLLNHGGAARITELMRPRENSDQPAENPR